MIDNCQASWGENSTSLTGFDATGLLAAEVWKAAILGNPQDDQFVPTLIRGLISHRGRAAAADQLSKEERRK